MFENQVAQVSGVDKLKLGLCHTANFLITKGPYKARAVGDCVSWTGREGTSFVAQDWFYLLYLSPHKGLSCLCQTEYT